METSACLFPNVVVPTMADTSQLGSHFGLTKNVNNGVNVYLEPEKYSVAIKAAGLAVSA